MRHGMLVVVKHAKSSACAQKASGQRAASHPIDARSAICTIHASATTWPLTYGARELSRKPNVF
eukprot:5682817-Lingulodinium_polyedra.AAC.1